jgi:hypothetical protein
MDTPEIIGHIDQLVAEERELRSRATGEPGLTTDDRTRLKALEVQLDQCWDLLRQRRAKTEYGQDPNTAHPRPTTQVEGYLT